MTTTSVGHPSFRASGFCALTLFLSACGGGGGGGGNPTPAPTVTFSADRTAITFDYAESTVPPTQNVTITAVGTLPGTLFVGATVEGQGISQNIQLLVSDNQGTFSLSPAAALAPGEYTGRVLLKACSDSACSQQIGNSPVAVSYTVRVRPSLKVTPNQSRMSATSGVGALQIFTVQLPEGATTSTASILAGSGWLSIHDATPTGFTLNAASVPSGRYSATVQVAAGSSTVLVPVTYEVAAPPGGDRQLSVTPSSLTLATVEGATSPTVTLNVTPPSWSPTVGTKVTYPAGGPTGWLTMTPVAGGFQATANALDLAAGSYAADVEVTAAWPHPGQIVRTSLTVGVGLVRPANETVTLNAETAAGALNRSTPTAVVAGPAAGWSAASNASWLVVTKASGQTPDALTYRLDSTAVAALANAATYTATITITPTRTAMTPVRYDVTLEKRLPEVTSVGPYVHLAAQPVRVIVRGSGFNAVGNLNRLTIPGASITTADRVNDTEIVVKTGALSIGRYDVTISNALAMPVAASSVTIVGTTAFGATTTPTGGVLRSLTFDAERNALYGANLTLETVMRFRYSGGVWLTESVPYARAFDVGLSNDGTKVIASSSSYQTNTASIRLLDPVTFLEQSTTSLQGNLQPTFDTLGFGIKTTNDARSWFALGSQFANMTAFRADTRAVTTFPVQGASFFSGPWFAMSRDGERLLIVQTAGLSPSPPMLYMDAADSVVKTNPANLTFSYRFAVSEDGNRMLFDNGGEVRDRDFNLIGRIRLPTTQGQSPWVTLSWQLSHDGNRAYILAYREDFYFANVPPRVFVFDSSTRQTTQEQLPALGYFDLADYPTCRPQNLSGNDPCSNWSAIAGTISLDSRTLFFAGGLRLVVAPIPTMLVPLALPITVPSGRMVPWPESAK